MDDFCENSRRAFMRMVGSAGFGLTLAACLPSNPPTGSEKVFAKTEDGKVKADVEEVLPVEDLMREHGVLRRILLVYEASIARLEANQSLDPAIVSGAAGLIRRFIEDYHEALEEQYLFPHFEKAGKFLDLVRTLKEQHEAGRRVTATVLGLATPASFASATNRQALALHLRKFIRMYEPHAAREDTVLFPAFRSVITPKQYDAYGELFESKEHQLFGPNGFEEIVGQVAELEKSLGIYELSQFTP